MQLLQNISLEYRTGLIFGVTALLFTLIIGIIAGVKIDVIALRLLIMAPVYAIMGTGIVIILKKFVPEFYEVFNRLLSGGTDEGETLDGTGSDSGMRETDDGDSGISDAGGEGYEGEESEFSEMNTDEIPRVDPGEPPDLENPLDVSSGKLGRHILATEKVAKYEPKVMAEAVRTMMRKDED